jgi:hypothetical protein
VRAFGGLNIAAEVDVMDVRFHGASPVRFVPLTEYSEWRRCAAGCAGWRS